MLFALLGALIPVAAGIAVGWTAGTREAWLGPARIVALIAALAVAGVVLLPESAAQLGWPAALGAFAVGLLAPWLTELGFHRLGFDHHSTSSLALVGVALHQGVDGFEIGACHALGVGAWGVTVAIAIHSVPLVAALLVELGGSWMLAGLLMAATAAGVVAGFVGPGAAPALVAWLPPLVAGLLVHLLWHDLGHWVPSHEHGEP
jgi:hypothetical protein